jgi:hypothetical protein
LRRCTSAARSSCGSEVRPAARALAGAAPAITAAAPALPSSAPSAQQQCTHRSGMLAAEQMQQLPADWRCNAQSWGTCFGGWVQSGQLAGWVAGWQPGGRRT